MRMLRNILCAALVALVACLALNSVAKASNPPVPGAIPATKHEKIEQVTVEQTTERSIKSKKVKAKIRHYERVRRVRVAVHMRPGGVKSKRGCVDPVLKGWIRVGGYFTNTRKNGSPFADRWQKGRKICNPRRVRIGNRWFMKGTKDNCFNRGILIQVRGPKKKYRYKKVVEFKSYKEFIKVYKKWTTRTTVKTTTPRVTVTYSCPEGYTLDGTWCIPPKNSTTTPPPPPEAPGPNPQPSPNDPAPGGHQCYREEDNRPVDPLPDSRCPPGSYGA